MTNHRWLKWLLGVPAKKPAETIEETVAQHRQALNAIDHRLTKMEGRLRAGEARVDVRLKALEYRKDVISRASDSAE